MTSKEETPGQLYNRMKRMIDRPHVSEEHKQRISNLMREVYTYPDDTYREYEAILDEMGVPK